MPAPAPTDLSRGRMGPGRTLVHCSPAPAPRLSLWDPGKPVHLPVPDPDPAASAGSGCREPRWDCPAPGEALSPLPPGLASRDSAREGERQRPGGSPGPAAAPLGLPRPAAARPPGGGTRPGVPTVGRQRPGPASRRRCTGWSRGAEALSQTPTKPRTNPPLSLSRSRGPISRSLVWDSRLHSVPAPSILFVTWPLWSPKPLLPPSWSPGASQSTEASSDPQGLGSREYRVSGRSSGQYPSRPLQRARQRGQAQVLAGEGGSRGVAPACSLPAPSERICLSLVPPHPQHPRWTLLHTKDKTAAWGLAGCSRPPGGDTDTP